jgi:hypothetical protein
MKPNNYIYNSDTQSLGNYEGGTITFHVNNGQIIDPSAIIASQTIRARHGGMELLRMMTQVSTRPGSWFPGNTFGWDVLAHSADSGYITNYQAFYVSAHRHGNGDITFRLSSGDMGYPYNRFRTQLEESCTWTVKYRLFRQPV